MVINVVFIKLREQLNILGFTSVWLFGKRENGLHGSKEVSVLDADNVYKVKCLMRYVSKKKWQTTVQSTADKVLKN